MIFVDTNVVMYAVGRPHPLRGQARAFFERAVGDPGAPLCTSAEVLQDLHHADLPVRRLETLDAALSLVDSTIPALWSIEPDDVRMARVVAGRDPSLGARDLLHIACCLGGGVHDIHTFDRGLAAAFRRLRPRQRSR